MSERKVLNKYYPPDFDPAKIPRLHLPKDRQYTVRLMAPCNMKCKTCGEYIYKGKKFNARKETVIGEDYLGLKIFRFYIKCTRCLAEITFKTDPENADYIVEHGATRNFQALKLAEEQAEREQREKDEEEASNPMKLLEKRTQQSKQEMDVLESLEELRDLQQRHANVDYEKILSQHAGHAEIIRKKQEQEDEDFIRSVFKKDANDIIEKRIISDDDDSEEESSARMSQSRNNLNVVKPSDLLSMETLADSGNKRVNVWEKSLGSLSSKSSLASMVKPRTSTTAAARSDIIVSATSSLSRQPLTVPARSSGMSSRSSLSGLVKPKVTVTASSALAVSTPPATTSTFNGLGLIGAYSESSSEDDS